MALLPVERSIECVKELRQNYWASDKDGFHVTKTDRLYGEAGVLVPALISYGRSVSLRYSHISDPMKPEISVATRLLKEKAKKGKWHNFEKDSVVISKGRETVVTTLPLRYLNIISKALSTLHRIWLMIIAGCISSSIIEDYVRFGDASKYLFEDVLRYVFERNLKDEHGSDELQRSLSELGHELTSEILKSLRIFRVLPQ
jgi:hypothetical protein